MLVIGIVLSVLAVVHAFIPMLPIFSVLYGMGASLALVSLLNVTNAWAVRVLAIASTGAMFLYFFGFFRLVHHFHDNWHRGGVASRRREAWPKPSKLLRNGFDPDYIYNSK